LCAFDAACDAWDRSSGRAPVLRKVNRTAAPWLPFTTTFRPRSASKPSCGLREIKSLLKENVSGARAAPKKPSKFQERDFVLFKNNNKPHQLNAKLSGVLRGAREASLKPRQV